MRSNIIGNTVSALNTAKKTFLNNVENVVNRKVDIREDIKRYQTLSVMHRAKLIIAWEKIFTCCLVI